MLAPHLVERRAARSGGRAASAPGTRAPGCARRCAGRPGAGERRSWAATGASSPRTGSTTRPRSSSTSPTGRGARLRRATSGPPGATSTATHVDVVPAPRSTGSVLKPLLYASMLEAGEVLPAPARPRRAHPHRLLPPRELRPRVRGGGARRAGPRPLAQRARGPACCARTASSASRPCCAASASRPSTRPGEHYGLALILGGRGGHALGRDRRLRRPRPIGPRADGRSGAAGVLRPDASSARTAAAPTGRRAARSPLSPAASYLTLQAMLEVERPGDELAWRAFSSSRKIAWKTGTSYGFRDAWAVGVTPAPRGGRLGGQRRRARAVPASPATPRPRRSSSTSSTRSPARGWFAAPAAGLVDVDVCARSGMRAGPHCEARRAELVPRAGLDSPPCSFCRLVHTDARRRVAGARRLRAGGGDPLASPGSSCRRRWRPTTAASTPTTGPRRPSGPTAAPALGRLGQRLALARLPARGRRRLRPRRDGRLARPGGVRGRAPRPRRARLLAPRRRVPGGDARHPPDGARAPARAARPRPRGRAGRDGPAPLHGRGPERPRFCYASRRACSSAG